MRGKHTKATQATSPMRKEQTNNETRGRNSHPSSNAKPYSKDFNKC